MANTQIKLEIETGAGDRILVANVGYFNSSHQPLYNICFFGVPIDSFHNKSGAGAVADLTTAIQSLRVDRASYLGLTAIEQTYRVLVLDLCLEFRNLCLRHPSSVISLTP
jgi:hypothetical protein